MSYLYGKILSMGRDNPRCRRIESREGQPFQETYFFHISLAEKAGYEERDLVPGRYLHFLGEIGEKGPKVKSFKPNPRVVSAGSFHNPYHFVPLAPPRSLESAESVLGGTLHDRWTFSEGEAARYSGRILCRLTTVTPAIFGGEQESREGQPAKVKPFSLPLTGDAKGLERPAIPGSSLRGLLSSLVEAASCSTLRVLKDENLKVRDSRLRKKVSVGQVHVAFERVDRNLVPLHDGREVLTLAERLFGFVEDSGQGRALAGRVSVSHALCDDPQNRESGGWYGEEKLLKILASPKPPSPAFYFGGSEGLKKKELDLRRHRPKGRKMYLHHRTPIDPESKPDSSKDHMKLKARPVVEGEAFYFHVDFDHLSREELAFLAYSLAPSDSFRHKLGLGKPLGLGTVQIEPLSFLAIDRKERYQPAGLFSPRFTYREEVGAPGAPIRNAVLSFQYREELEPGGKGSGGASWPGWQELVLEARQQIPEEVRKTLETLGDPDRIRADVTYPLRDGQDQEKEGEHFQWFVENENRPQGLGQVVTKGPGGKEKVEVPLLEKN